MKNGVPLHQPTKALGFNHASTTGRGLSASGFTLVELAVVLLLIGLLSGVASLKLAGIKQAAQPTYWAQHIGMQDRQARERSQQTGSPFDLIFDLEAQQLRIEPTDPTTKQELETPTLTMTNNWRIQRIWRPPGSSQTSRSTTTGDTVRSKSVQNMPQTTRATDRGQVPIRISSKGWSSDYALQLIGPNNQTVLLVTSGLTGTTQRIEPLTDAQTTVDNLLITTLAKRLDAR